MQLLYQVSGGEGGVTAQSMLIDFIRNEAKLKGTKVLCREGGCGACVVSVTSLDPVSGCPQTRSINSVSYTVEPIYLCMVIRYTSRTCPSYNYIYSV
jgi:xanthine dehydrogenase iron-sulfur cluster and FAD-binding subunit A